MRKWKSENGKSQKRETIGAVTHTHTHTHKYNLLEDRLTKGGTTHE